MKNGLFELDRNSRVNIHPRARLKEAVTSLLYRYYDPDNLDALVTEVEMLEDGSLHVELDCGVRFFTQQNGKVHNTRDHLSPRRYRSGKGKPHQSAKTEEVGSFRNLWYVLREIYIRNIYQKYYKVKKGDIVVDAGANIGVFTVKAAKAVGDEGMVIAIEPEQDNLKFLERNVLANGLRNVVIISRGVWSSKDTLKLFIRGQTGHHSLVLHDGAHRFAEVEVDTLDNILEELGIHKVDFIKMDIEGAEIEACKGMAKTLSDNDVKIAIEVHKIGGVSQTSEIIASSLDRCGFQVYVEGTMVYGMKPR